MYERTEQRVQARRNQNMWIRNIKQAIFSLLRVGLKHKGRDTPNMSLILHCIDFLKTSEHDTAKDQ